MVGSSPRNLTIMQLLATPIGAAAVSWMYPLLRSQYGIGDKGLSSPISVKWKGFAEILSSGFDALPQGALIALIVGVLVGILLATLEVVLKDKTWVPSPTGLGIGMLVPAAVILTMFFGAIVGKVWSKASPRTSEQYLVPLASGLIAGEALRRAAGENLPKVAITLRVMQPHHAERDGYFGPAPRLIAVVVPLLILVGILHV